MLTVRSLLVITAIAWPALGQFCEHQWEGQFAERGIDAQEASSAEAPDLDIRPLIISGPSSNRVDLIFFGDGCNSAPYPNLSSGTPGLTPYTRY